MYMYIHIVNNNNNKHLHVATPQREPIACRMFTRHFLIASHCFAIGERSSLSKLQLSIVIHNVISTALPEDALEMTLFLIRSNCRISGSSIITIKNIRSHAHEFLFGSIDTKWILRSNFYFYSSESKSAIC